MEDHTFVASVANEMVEKMRKLRETENKKQMLEQSTKLALEEFWKKTLIILENASLWEILVLINFCNNSRKIGDFFDSNKTLCKLKSDFVNQLKHTKAIDAMQDKFNPKFDNLTTEDKLNIAFSIFDFRTFYVKENIKELSSSSLLNELMALFLDLSEEEISAAKEHIFNCFAADELILLKRKESENRMRQKMESTTNGKIVTFLESAINEIKDMDFFKLLNK